MQSSLNFSAGDNVHQFLCLWCCSWMCALPSCSTFILNFPLGPWRHQPYTLPLLFSLQLWTQQLQFTFWLSVPKFSLSHPPLLLNSRICGSWSSCRNDASALRHCWSPTYLISSSLAPVTCGRGRKQDKNLLVGQGVVVLLPSLQEDAWVQCCHSNGFHLPLDKTGKSISCSPSPERSSSEPRQQTAPSLLPHTSQ